MRRLVVAELVLLAVGLLLAAALLLHYCRNLRGIRATKRPSELPLSRPCSSSPTKRGCLRLLLTLCSGRRRARVEPTAASCAEPAAPATVAASEAEDVAAWRERWFGPASRALYTIDEADEAETSSSEDEGDRDGEETQAAEPETPFFTPPASPSPRLGGQSPPAA